MNDLTKQQNHSTSCASFNFEIFNFKNFTCPFGLRHEIHYPSSSIRDFRAAEGLNGGQVGDPVQLINVTKTEYMYRYQGQERQDELGLNWDSFKWRNYDYAIGRFFNVDPLSEKYAYQSHYNFAENRVVDGRELEGLEWVDAKGNQVYDPKKGEYTSHATSNDKKLGNTLRDSGDTGAAQFNKLVNSNHPISVSYDLTSTADSKGGYELGITGNLKEGMYVNSKGEVVGVEISESDITLNIVVAEEFVADIKSGSQLVDGTFDQAVKDNNVSWFDVIVATFGHEIEHTTSENQTTKANGGDVEQVPRQIGEQILNDIINKQIKP